MAPSRIQSVVTYSTSSGGQTYYYDIVVDSQGSTAVRNIRGPRGLITDPYTTVPAAVLDDIEAARSLTSQTLVETEVTHGDLTFTGQTYQDAVIAPGVLNNTNYRVVYTTTDGVELYTENKTTTGFRGTVGVTYGTVLVPKIAHYSVLVSTHQSSTVGGTLTFAVADAGQKTVTFATAMESSDYRVVLSPDGFFPAYVVSQSTTSFTVEIGYTLGAVETVTVGFDVFM
jgi:hypothetical protein